MKYRSNQHHISHARSAKKDQEAICAGKPFPPGATWDGKGVNFALFSENAEKVELCLFDETGTHEIERIPLPSRTDNMWHGYLPDLAPGQLYGYRVHGPYDPQNGHRFNPNKLLMDPYAKDLFGKLEWHPAIFGYQVGHADQDFSFDTRDSAPYVPKSVVVDPGFDWHEDAAPQISWPDSLIYEMHVKGMTATHPDVPEEIRGTYAALSDPAIISHLKGLGVTAVELLPVFPIADEHALAQKGLKNYWGYNPFSFFAPEQRYMRKDGVREFKSLVKTLHDNRIEVLLDVVFNHTGEGNHMGPTIGLKGIDNASYYRLVPENRHDYINDSGCGNTLNMSHPSVLRMVMDSLRYWAADMRVDGFRFDLAATLTRTARGFEESPFLMAVAQDPLLSRIKMIAEPWDIGPGGYRLGCFGPGWSEWNDKFRDTVREYVRGGPGQIGPLAGRLSGSRDIFERHQRGPSASINKVTAHDGFTLHDLVSFNGKHNHANGEDNRDGSNDNRSWNCGAEGPTDHPAINALRAQQKRNFMALLFLSQGTPMLLAGDEIGNSQDGNNNAYCQDNEIGWINWDRMSPADHEFLGFVRKLSQVRRSHPLLHRKDFFHGMPVDETGVRDITWLSPAGREMKDGDWNLSYARCFGFQLADGVHTCGQDGPEPRVLVMMNSHHEPLPFRLPELPNGRKWRTVFDTACPVMAGTQALIGHVGGYDLKARSIVMLVEHELLMAPQPRMRVSSLRPRLKGYCPSSPGFR
ncbi:MAG TPA: glycogen debranching enzyme GlgX [Rhodospirillaceae bacterium]|nr:MAG: glycogen debranching enzyme GlgX [Alphaproteobacteria bacterium GWF2_58_20]HAU28644.1 glycogen debranching enzyme GlgX [Rhodospirillaceae bacterium]